MQDHSLTATRDVLVKDVDNLKKNAVKIVQDVREHATAHVDDTKKKVSDTVQQVWEIAGSHPLAVLGAGLAIGFFFGLRRRA